MINVEIELWPFGDPSQMRPIARLKIANITCKAGNTADYAVVIESMEGEKWAYVRGYDRRKGAVPLIQTALRNLQKSAKSRKKSGVKTARTSRSKK